MSAPPIPGASVFCRNRDLPLAKRAFLAKLSWSALIEGFLTYNWNEKMHKFLIAILALTVLTGCSSWRWWPFGPKKIDSGFKDPTYDLDHQPGIPQPQTVKPK